MYNDTTGDVKSDVRPRGPRYNAGVFVTVLIPCHNEVEALPSLFQALDALPRLIAPHFPEVVFVDDGSTDATPHTLYEFAARAAFPCRVLGLSPNEGIGVAVREGARLAAGEAVVTYDADRAYPIEDVKKLVDAVEAGADVASATPFAPGGAVAGVGLRRSFLSRACSLAYRVRLVGRARGVRTFTCGFRAWRAATLMRCLPSRSRFPATAEMLLLALRDGAKVVEIPSVLRDREHGVSKLKVARTIAGHLGLLATGPRAASAPRGVVPRSG